MPSLNLSVPVVACTFVKSVAEYLTIGGVLGRLLIGSDGKPLKGLDGQYLYGSVT